MTGFPSIKDDLRPRPKLKRHNDTPVSDAEIEANSVAIGQKWGAATSLPASDASSDAATKNSSPVVADPSVTASVDNDSASEPSSLQPIVPEPARVISIRGYIPHYLDDELALKAVQRRVTKTFLIMEALEKAGYRVDDIDMVQDRRKRSRLS